MREIINLNVKTLGNFSTASYAHFSCAMEFFNPLLKSGIFVISLIFQSDFNLLHKKEKKIARENFKRTPRIATGLEKNTNLFLFFI